MRKYHFISFGWKFVAALVENSCIFRLSMGHWLGMGGSTVVAVMDSVISSVNSKSHMCLHIKGV